MRKLIQWSFIAFILVILFGIGTASHADNGEFGIRIEQRALDVFMLMSQRSAEVLGAPALDQTLSIKAKIIFADLIAAEQFTGPIATEILQNVPEMIVQTQIGISRAKPDLVNVNITSNLGNLQFAVSDSQSVAILPDEGVFAEMNVPQMLPNNLMLQDDGGLLTLINLMGGIPYGTLFRQASGGGMGGDNIIFGDVNPENLRANIRYWGTDSTDGGVAHVVNILTSGVAPYSQSMKIWVLAETLDLYQISIEDERGTQVFVVFDEINVNPAFTNADFVLDTSGLAEVNEEEFLAQLVLKVVTSPVIEGPVAVDIYASSHQVARTGVVTISTDGFDMQNEENELLLEMEYKSPIGSWNPLEVTEYAGLTPLGHWNAIFAPGADAAVGMYSFRAQYTDSSGNTSGWLEVHDLVEVIPAPPRVVRTIPFDGDEGNPVTTRITIEFSKPMDMRSVEGNFVMGAGFKSVKGSFSWDGKTLTFTPTDPLKHDTEYFVLVSGEAKDTEGLGLDANYDTRSDGKPYDDYFWTFTTGPVRPVLEVVWQKRTIRKGSGFDVKIVARNMKQMQSFSIKLAFNPEVLQAMRLDAKSFLSWQPGPQHIKVTDSITQYVKDNMAGSVKIVNRNMRPGGVSGYALIANISFYARGAGETLLRFDEISIHDSRGKVVHPVLNVPDIRVMGDPVSINNVQAAPSVAKSGMGQNFPNPFNPETWIPYQLAQPSRVTIRIYRSTGELTRTLDLGVKEMGTYAGKEKAAYWDGTDDVGQKVSSGVYFYSIQADGFTETRKMLLLQ